VITPDEHVNEDALRQLVGLVREFPYLRDAKYPGHEDFVNAQAMIKKAKVKTHTLSDPQLSALSLSRVP
jgi:hypothetical protein